jgi:hypothetical protein
LIEAGSKTNCRVEVASDVAKERLLTVRHVFSRHSSTLAEP